MNTGITLGRYDLGKFGIALPAVSAPGFVESCELALEHGWSKEKIGSHVVRNNHISHCEKNGIHGSLGGIFSVIEGNTICGSSINLFLATLGGFIHPMRLTFVEFYKNAGFQGGGKKYHPFTIHN